MFYYCVVPVKSESSFIQLYLLNCLWYYFCKDEPLCCCRPTLTHWLLNGLNGSLSALLVKLKWFIFCFVTVKTSHLMPLLEYQNRCLCFIPLSAPLQTSSCYCDESDAYGRVRIIWDGLRAKSCIFFFLSQRNKIPVVNMKRTEIFLRRGVMYGKGFQWW